ncbi:Uncharacterised protein [Moraxella ovis]|uniref:Uncharacterized protein n=1 Tax=Moraxella ovis TaxID=29433 RepID=A0A378PJL8_9GAMM|nr:hypothetical protein [Moraxella ovis]SPX85154.1 Uncharacterised protein [Moraxella ovis]STY86954.1 Uncharacterised protein [Moraxella ovis]STZ05148.1 Uncharacterised protein [Moraxella ovis]
MVENYSAFEALEAKAAQEQAQTLEQSKAAQAPQKQELTALDGFIGGLTGARKKAVKVLHTMWRTRLAISLISKYPKPSVVG